MATNRRSSCEDGTIPRQRTCCRNRSTSLAIYRQAAGTARLQPQSLAGTGRGDLLLHAYVSSAARSGSRPVCNPVVRRMLLPGPIEYPSRRARDAQVLSTVPGAESVKVSREHSSAERTRFVATAVCGCQSRCQFRLTLQQRPRLRFSRHYIGKVVCGNARAIF